MNRHLNLLCAMFSGAKQTPATRTKARKAAEHAVALCAMAVFLVSTTTSFAADPTSSTTPALQPLPPVRVSDNHRYLVTVDGKNPPKPFYFQGDTAWCIFNHPSPADVDVYLNDRQEKGFNVIQGCIAVWDYRTRANPDGQTPFTANDPTKINDAYFKNVDAILAKCTQRGMHMALLPFWTKNTRSGPFNDPAGMAVYCEYLAKRYAASNVIFVLGGDTAATDIMPVIDAEAAGLIKGAKEAGFDKITITYHPTGRESSSFWFQNRDWLDFNSIQSGHFINTTNFQIVTWDYLKQPTKPTFDMEPGYENITNNLVRDNPDAPRIQAVDVRRSAYLAVFAGACGHTYGNGEVYEFYHPPANGGAPAGNAGWHAPMEWKDALKLPASSQEQYVRYLVESRPYLTRIPDQSLIASPAQIAIIPPQNPGGGGGGGRGQNIPATTRIEAMRNEDGAFAFVYLPTGQKTVTINTSKLSGTNLKSWWYDPRTGKASEIDTAPKADSRTYNIPTDPTITAGNDDWVLVIDDASKNYPAPGKPK